MRPFRPMRPRREALPGLLIMVLIATAGVLFAVGVRDGLPRDLVERWIAPPVDVADIEIDPATGLPIVPPRLSDEVITWTPALPNSRIQPANAWASEQPPGTVDPKRQTVTVMATYASHQEAVAVAQDLAEAVGDPAAEAAWLEAAGVDAGVTGFGWVGPEGSSTPFVQVVDRRLLADGLEWSEEFESSLDGSDEADGTYSAPLVLGLQASASSVLVEGDFWGEGAIAFDLVCIGDADLLVTLREDLADAVTARARPPWIDPPLTLDERKARRTQRLVTELWASAFLDDAMRSGEMERLSRELAGAYERGGEEAIVAASEAIQAHLAELAPTALPDLGPLGEAVDTSVLAATMGEITRREIAAESTSDAADPAGIEASAFGAADAVPFSRSGSAYYDVRAEGRRLWVTLGSWFGIAQGFGPFVRYLDANGCDDVQVVFHDYDDVRGD